MAAKKPKKQRAGSARSRKKANANKVDKGRENAMKLNKIGLVVDVEMPDGTTLKNQVTRGLPSSFHDGHWEVGVGDIPGSIDCSRVTLVEGQS